MPRKRVLMDALADLAPQERERLKRSEVQLIEYLNGRAESAE